MASERIRWICASLGRILLGYPIPSTAQPSEVYCQRLFPEFATQARVIEFLKEKVTIDIGSGLTHKNPWSLMNTVLRAYPETKFIGIEPRVGNPIGHKQGFRRRNILVCQILWHLKTLGKVLTCKRIAQKTPGEHAVLSAVAQCLPVPDASIDMAISFFCIPHWIDNQDLFLKILREIERVLVVGGEMRMAPVSETWQKTMANSATPVGQYIRSHFHANTRSKQRLIVLTKKSKE